MPQVYYNEKPPWDNAFDIGDLVVYAALATTPPHNTVAEIVLFQVTDMAISKPGEYVIRSLDSQLCYTRQEEDLADASCIPGLVERYNRMSNQQRKALAAKAAPKNV